MSVAASLCSSCRQGISTATIEPWISVALSLCGGIASHTFAHPHSEPRMGDYREDVRERPARHPAAEARMQGVKARARGKSFTPPSLTHKKGQR